MTTTRDQTTHLALVHRPIPQIIDLSHAIADNQPFDCTTLVRKSSMCMVLCCACFGTKAFLPSRTIYVVHLTQQQQIQFLTSRVRNLLRHRRGFILSVTNIRNVTSTIKKLYINHLMIFFFLCILIFLESTINLLSSVAPLLHNKVPNYWRKVIQPQRINFRFTCTFF